MSDPKRLLDESPSAFDRSLLASATTDDAPAGAEDRALAALGLVVAGGTVAAGAAAASKVGASAPPAAAAVSKIATAVLLKWLGVGVLASAATAGTVAYVATVTPEAPHLEAPAAAPQTRDRAAAPPPRNTPAPPPVDPPAEPIPEPTAVAIATATPTPTPTATATANANANATPTANATATPTANATATPIANATPAPPPVSISPEIALLDRARRALREKDPATALRALDDYDARFPNGSMREEADVARMEALAASGDNAGAAAKARVFLEKNPESAYGSRVRAILRRTNP